jgi:dCTP deaminase
MGLKPDRWIRKMALEQRMIEPFVDGQVRDGVISYGLSSYGYDIRVADEFKIFQPEITAAKMSDVQCAYVAGMLDAQAQIGYTTSGPQGRPGLALVVASDNRAMLEGLQAVVGTGCLRDAGAGKSEWVVSKAADVQHILSQVWPYLAHRRDTASRALAELKSAKSIVVDPKHFDADSFVDFKGDVCVIPPNSFTLSRTVEYFRVPRSALTVCVGKSTYARCFRGDTRVALVDGTAPTLEEMARRSDDGELFWGYSVGSYGRIIATVLDAPRYVGRDSLIEVVLDTDESIFCTPDHMFLTRGGMMVKAHQLRPGSSLLPLYRQVARGYEMLFQPLEGRMYPTHSLADEWNLRHGLYEDLPNTHRHHLDGDRRNNRPWNIERMDSGEHIRLHNQESYGQDFDPDEHSVAIREALDRLAQDADWRKHYRLVQRERALLFWHDDAYAAIREGVVDRRRNPPEETRQAHRLAMLERYRDPAERVRQSELMKAAWAKDDGARRQRQAEIAQRINLRDEITAEVVRAALDQTGSIRGAAKLLNCDRSVFRRFPKVIRAFKGQGDNHRVVAVRDVPGDHDVFCVTVPEAGNFALEAGVFVRNCGIIVNVTPFEPMWEGFVTLEISNTTPLPAKIYANEGIAQVLFFEADEECEVSYADKKGKYQAQQSIVLPRL